MNIESTAALEDEACYSQQAKRLEPVEGMNRDAADLVVTQDAGRQRTRTRSQEMMFHIYLYLQSLIQIVVYGHDFNPDDIKMNAGRIKRQ